MKRVLAILTAVCIVISLAACAVNTPPVTPKPDGQPSTNTPSTPEPPTDHETPPESNDPTPPPADDETSEQPPEDDTSDPDDPEIPTDPETDDPEQTEDPENNEDPEDNEDPDEYVRTIDPSRPMVALTFDDGPHEQFSHQILDVLEANHAVATFFEVGYNAVRYPEILARMAQLGCEIGSHSYYHYDLTTLSFDAMLTDLAKLDKIVYNATGQMPTIMRPPYGAVNSNVKYKTGRAVFLWTVDTRDWQLRDAAKLTEYIQNYGSLDGEIVLMHSIHGSTAEAMETVIPWLIEQGYQLVTVSELMAYYYGELPEANKYYNQNFFAKHERTEFPIELPEEPMETQIPEFNTVPVKPIQNDPPPEQNDTPPDTPPEGTDTPPEGTDTPPEGTDTPPEGTDTPPEGTDTPPEGTDAPPEGADTPPEGTDTPPEEDTPPSEDEPSLPPEGPVLPPEENPDEDNEGTESGDENTPPTEDTETPEGGEGEPTT